MEKIAAVVILYHPEEKTLDYIQSYYNYVEKLYVVDNSEQQAAIRGSLKKLEKVIYLHDGRNKGIAEPLNIVCNLAIKDGFDWLLTMDQDSYFIEKDILQYQECIKTILKEQIALAGIEFIKKDNGLINCQYSEVTSLITSGSIINLSAFKSIGAFDENLFIDQVDFEYCYRAISKGYKVIQFKNIFLEHSLGVVSVHKSFKTLRNSNRSLHSPERIYYMTRNYLFIHSKYKNSFGAEVAKTKKDLLYRIKNNILYNKNKFLTVKYILLGLLDFYRGRMGKMKEGKTYTIQL